MSTRRSPALKAANAMDFDDLMLHPLTLFREHPDRLAWWRDRFAFVLVDEFQDTNKAQYELVRHLGGHGTSSPSATTTSRSTAGAAPK